MPDRSITARCTAASRSAACMPESPPLRRPTGSAPLRPLRRRACPTAWFLGWGAGLTVAPGRTRRDRRPARAARSTGGAPRDRRRSSGCDGWNHRMMLLISSNTLLVATPGSMDGSKQASAMPCSKIARTKPWIRARISITISRRSGPRRRRSRSARAEYSGWLGMIADPAVDEGSEPGRRIGGAGVRVLVDGGEAAACGCRRRSARRGGPPCCRCSSRGSPAGGRPGPRCPRSGRPGSPSR